MRTSTKVLLYSIVVSIASWVFAIHESDPLRTMQRLANQRTAISGHLTTTTDDQFYNEANRLALIIQHDLGAKLLFGQPESPEALGETSYEDRSIVIQAKLHWTARFETMTHEAGHLLCPPFQVSSDREVCAEAVGGLTDFYAGDVGALQRSADYLTFHKGSLHILSDYRQDIIRAAKFLSGQ